MGGDHPRITSLPSKTHRLSHHTTPDDTLRVSKQHGVQCSANDHPDCQTELPAPPANLIWVRYLEKSLESPTRSPSNLLIPFQHRQNTLLSQQIESGRAIFNSLRISWDSSSTHHPSSLERTLHNTRFFLRKPFPPRLPQRDDNTHRSPRRLARQLTLIPSTRQLPPSHTHA